MAVERRLNHHHQACSPQQCYRRPGRLLQTERDTSLCPLPFHSAATLPSPPPPKPPLRSLLHIPFVIFQGRQYPPSPTHPLHSSIPTCQHGPPVILKLQALRELLSVYYTDDLAICFSSRFDVCVTSCSFQEIRFPHLVVSTSR